MPSFWQIIMPVFGLMGARLAGAGLAFLSQLLLARSFPAYDVGIAFLAMSIATFMSMILSGGYNSVALTYLARYQAFGRKRLIDAFLAAARRDMLVAMAVAVCVAVLLAFLPLPPDIGKAILFGVVAALPLAFLRLNNAAANAARRFVLTYAPEFTVRPGLLFLAIGGIVLFAGTSNIDYVLVAFLLIAFVVPAGQTLLLGVDNAFARFGKTPRRDLRPYLRKRAAAMLVVSIVAGATADLVVMLAGALVPADEVAVLGIAIRLAALVGFFAGASQQFVLRELAQTLAHAGRAEVDALLLRTNLAGLASMLAAIAFVLVFGHWVLGLFGSHYVAGYWPLVIFLAAQAVRVLGGMNGQLLALGGHQVQSALPCVAAVATLGAFSTLLVGPWGVTGMAAATLMAEIVWALGLAVLAQRLEGRRADLFSLLAPR